MDRPKRKLTRLSGYDYSLDNFYFITACTYEKRPLFGRPDNLNEYGKIAENVLISTPEHFDDVIVDQHIVMPNHVHAIIIIGCDMEEREKHSTLSAVVGSYKSGVSKRIHLIEPGIRIWQRSYYDHIIRNEESYREICQYIYENPLRAQFKNDLK